MDLDGFFGAVLSPGGSSRKRQQLTSTDSPLRSQIFTRDEMASHAMALARQHQVELVKTGVDLFSRFEDNQAVVERAYFAFAKTDGSKEQLTPGAEWLLDNYHVIEEHVRDIRRHLPRSYYRTLPKLVSQEFKGYPRVYHIAAEVVAHSDAVIDTDVLTGFVQAYQTEALLSIGELWAVPIMLRLALIENLRRLSTANLAVKDARKAAEELIDEILGDEARSGTDILLDLASYIKEKPELLSTGAVHLIRRLRGKGLKAALTLQWLEERLREQGIDPEELIRQEHQSHAANQISIGNTVTSLKTVSALNWKAWFESLSKVDAVLARDPAAVYTLSDFPTRDRIRHQIEKLARATKKTEVQVAEIAYDLAAKISLKTEGSRDEIEQNTRERHVGYYLIGAGRADLEKALNFVPPFYLKVFRYTKDRAFFFYSGAILLITALVLVYIALYAGELAFGPLFTAVLVSLCLIPVSHLANDVVQWIVTHLTIPFVLPKLDFEKSIPGNSRSLVAVHYIFNEKELIRRAVEQLEVRYLGNEDENLYFALLADLPDAKTEHAPGDKDLIHYAERLIEDLNAHYAAENKGVNKFFLLFRRRVWDEAQGCFMGWERKRGKIMELNKLILGADDTTFLLNMVDLDLLRSVKYVITLDGDTQLPRGVARKLVGAIAHPLNRPVFDPVKKIVVKGYGIIQPRVGVALTSANVSLFSKILSGHAGLDPYTSTVSDVYQDLFSEGSFVGKAIYDVAAFERALSERVPVNALLSHDLFEGLFVRVALATDIELIDEFPSRYNAFAKRQHRWVRGDWQLLPWMFGRIPDASRKKYKNPISQLGRWKLDDNLRRSLLAPTCFAVLLFSWIFLAASPLFLDLMVVLVIAFPVYANLANAFISPPLGMILGVYVRGLGRDLFKHSQQAILSISFLPFQAYLMSHAIIVTLFRVYISKRNLLEWETALHAEKRLGVTLFAFLRQMFPGLLLTAFTNVVVYYFAFDELIFAGPFLILWYLAPVLAWLVSQPITQGDYGVSKAERAYLKRVAWDTWRFFESLMNERNNYLIPDNVQLIPSRVIAERTSPTNMGLALFSIITAHDFGFLPLSSSIRRLDLSYSTLNKLEKFRGHFLNWYQTVTLQALYPRYVSVVDSGNFIANIMAVRVAVQEFLHAPIVKDDHWSHLKEMVRELEERDGAKLLSAEIEEIRGSLKNPPNGLTGLNQLLKLVQALLDKVESSEWRQVLTLKEDEHTLIESVLYELRELVSIRDLFAWHQPLSGFSKFLGELQSKGTVRDLPLLEKRLSSVQKITEGRALTISLLFKVHRRLAAILRSFREANQGAALNIPGAQQVVKDLEDKLTSSSVTVERLIEQIEGIGKSSTTIIEEADFTFLFDERKNVFTIGYNVDDARRDNSYYDLLASECRVSSLVAIASGQIPQKHWFALGRALTDSSGGKALLSWSGTMFEYLMPLLVTKDYPGTILSETYRSVVKAQENYGRRRQVPWGVSESGYSGVDFEKTYQYHAFGVPGLGLKRGLSEDLVISPYSTFLALPIDPTGAISNAHYLEREGVRGEFGFFEAVDYTQERLSAEEKSHVVKSFLAHHQGMTLVSINNFLNTGIFQNRFHADPSIKATELLLQERFPHRVPAIVPHQAELSKLEAGEEDLRVSRGETINTAHTKYPRTRLLSNGRYSLLIDNAGSGWSFVDKDVSLTRWREDVTRNDYGTYIFVRDLDSDRVWSVAYQPTRVEPEYYEVIFNPDKVEFKRRDFGIALQTEITISTEDNVEVRRVTVKNLSTKPRRIELTSYAEVVLGKTRADSAHPAFAKMFIESEFVPDFDALIFSRRPRSIHEEKLYMMHMVSMSVVWEKLQYETSRAHFIGRGNTIHNPSVFSHSENLNGSVGPVLDPIFSLRTRLMLEPSGSAEAAFITTVSNSKEELLRLAKRYHEVQSVTRAFEMAWSQSNVELRHEQITIAQTHMFQRLANAIVFNIEGVRGGADSIARNRLQQSGFWRFGISGDLPIVLVRVSDPSQIKTVQEMLLAHWYLRLRGLSFDLIILNEYPGGYMQAFHEELEAMIKHGYSASVAEKNGGVFLRKLGQLSDNDIILLQAVARVVISGAKGGAFQQLAAIDSGEIEPLKPRKNLFSYIKEEPFSKFEPPSAELEFFNGTGGFADGGNAYSMIVKDGTLPPLPWCNVVANPKFGFMISESGGGYTWSDNSRENRLTPWSNDPVSDYSGEVVYIRDSDSGQYWSATPGPVGTEEAYAVKHSFGYSEFDTQVKGIFSRLTVSGATEEPVKWWNLKLVNGDLQERHVEVFLYVEWILGILREDASRHVVSDFDPMSQTLFAVNHYNNEFAGRYLILGGDAELSTFTTSREEFIGRNRDTSSPYALESAVTSSLANLIGSTINYIELSKKVGAGFDQCAVLGFRIKLNPGEERSLLLYMGESPSLEERKRDAARYKVPAKRADELTKVKQMWLQLTGSVKLQSPDRSFDIMMNGWLLYQALSCRIYGRSAFYQSGGAFGFRDQLQDSLALLYSRPDLVRNQILIHAARQFVEGDVQHWWHPPTGRGVRTKISDDYLWLPYVVHKYIEVTGDRTILDQEVSFIEGQHLEENQHEAYIVPNVSSRIGSIYEHCIIALDRALKFGPHGLPLIGCGDWNDGMNEVGIHGKGESIWLGWFLWDVLNKFSSFVSERRDTYRADEYKRKAEFVRDSIEKNAWDGHWYRRAYFDDGTPLGSATSKECRIDSLAQSWGVITGAGDQSRCREAMQNVYKELVDRENGIIKLLFPPFDVSEPRPGYIAGYLPGIRENGAQYTHAGVWVIMATAVLGDGDLALDLFGLINPINHAKDPKGVSRYQGEPYVTCGDVYSVPPHGGRAGWSWYTGSASWLYTVGVEYIAGLRVKPDYFTLEPCVPKDWKEFNLTCMLRGREYRIAIYNPGGVSHGVRTVYVNGIEVADGRVLFGPATEASPTAIDVRVVMGASSR